MKVLVIDDDAIVVDAVQCSLKGMGHDVTIRPSALGASAWILREQPDLVLVDLNMPALPGDAWLDLVTQDDLTGEGGTSPVFVVYSGRSVDELERVVRETCAIGYIRKDDGIDGFELAFEKIIQDIA